MSNLPTSEQIIQVLEEAVLCEPGLLSPATSVEDIEGWDSAAGVYFIGEVLGRWNAELSADDVRNAAKVGDLVRRVLETIPP